MKTPPYLLENILAIRSKVQTPTRIASSFYRDENELVKDILASFPKREILREDVTALFSGDPMKGVYAAMIWGGMSTGGVMGNNFGKLLKISRDELSEVIDRLRNLRRDGDVKQAYDYMENGQRRKIEGLGHAFFTKIFFFLSVVINFKVIAPIYDKWTKLAHFALLHNAGDSKVAAEYFTLSKDKGQKEVVVNLRSCGSDAYDNYVTRMEAWANDLNVNVCTLETYIFGNHRGRDKSPENPRAKFSEMLRNQNK